MSLHDARMPSLRDKLKAEAEIAERLQEKKEKEDDADKKVIKKAAKKD